MGAVIDQFNRDRYKGIADKIIQLLDKTYNSRLSSKRWVWELMQNAKDVPNKFGRVSIRIELWQDKLIFSHNGDCFTIGNISGLIQQVSSKDSANEGELKQTGKFGTGFITTHLLSKIIKVNGVVENPNTGKYQHFTLNLDRSAHKSEDMIPCITKNLEKFEGLDKENCEDFPIVEDYESRGESSFDTSFTYYLGNDSLRAAQVGLNDLINTLPITMVSLPKIKSVEVIDHISNENQLYVCNSFTLEKNETSEVIESVIDINEGKKYFLTYKTYEESEPVVALSIESKLDNNGNYVLVKRDKEQPVLFRDFPLIGSEEFYFPFMLNGFNFEPTETRSGILLNNDEYKPKKNRAIIEKAIETALAFNEWLVSQNVSNTYLLASSRKPKPEESFDDIYAKPWIENLQKQWRSLLLQQNLVETSSGYCAIDNIKVPDYGRNKEANQTFYTFLKDFMQDGILPLQDQLEEWSNVIFAEYPTWNANLKYTKQDFFEDLQRVGCIANLCERIQHSEAECYQWLNDLYKFVEEQGDEEYLEKYPVIPNQHGDFCLLGDLCSDSSQRIPNQIKDICIGLLDRNLYDELISESISDQVFKKKREYSFANLITDLNSCIHNAIEKGNFVYQRDWDIVSQGVYGILALKTDNEEEKQSLRDRIYAFVHSYVQDLPEQEFIESMPEALWTEADMFVLKSIPQLVEKHATTLEELGNEMLTYPQKHTEEECIAWINEYGKLCKYFNYTITQEQKIYPNQLGQLKSLSDLHYDNDIPEPFKDLANYAYDSDGDTDIYRSRLLLRSVTGFEQYNPLSTKDIYEDVKKRFVDSNDFTKDVIARHSISILVKNEDGDTVEKELYDFAKALYVDEIPNIQYVTSSTGFNWGFAQEFYIKKMCSDIAETTNLNGLKQLSSTFCEYETKELTMWVDSLIEFLHSYKNKKYWSVITDKDTGIGIWINQNGDFCKFQDVREDSSIPNELKDIALNRHVNKDFREELFTSDSQKALYLETTPMEMDEIGSYIDDMIKGYDGNKQDNDFRSLVFSIGKLCKRYPELEESMTYFKANQNSLIVWSLGEGETMDLVGAIVQQGDEKLKVVKDILEGNSLQELHDIKDVLNGRSLESVKELLNKISEIEKETADDVETKVVCTPIIHSITAITPNGTFDVHADNAQYAGLPLEDVIRYVQEAKAAVVKHFKQLRDENCKNYTFDTERIAMDSYSQLYGIYDPDGNEIPLVVHSYKGPQYRYFDLNWYDWQLLSKPGSMLWVLTMSGLQCIPMYALPIRNIHLAVEGMPVEKQALLITSGLILKKMLEGSDCIHFDFGNNMPHEFNNPVPFDYLPNKVNNCISTISEIYNKEIPAIASEYNTAPNFKLIESSNGYSAALKQVEEDETEREKNDLPDNPLQAPAIGADFEDIL